MKKVLGLLTLGLLLTGCSNNKETTTICKGSLDEITDSIVTIQAKGDETTKMTNKVTYDFTNYISDQTPITYYEDLVKEDNDELNDLKGVKANYKIEGTKITLTVTVDYKKADFKQLADAKLIVQGTEGEVKYISLKQTIAQQTKAGLTCKEK